MAIKWTNKSAINRVIEMAERHTDRGSQFTTGHAFDCRKGGLVIQRHNEIRDALGDLASIAYKEVLREPVIRDRMSRKMFQL